MKNQNFRGNASIVFSPEEGENVMREVRLLASLNHPHIVQYKVRYSLL
jgi:hypothetical protein